MAKTKKQLASEAIAKAAAIEEVVVAVADLKPKDRNALGREVHTAIERIVGR
jgi:hypothetical protein